MPRYLNTFGRSTLGIGICDRCRVKMSLDEMMPDGNSPGLRVCINCRDNLDPYRLPARKSENIALRYPRPDVPIPSFPIPNTNFTAEDGTRIGWINNDGVIIPWLNNAAAESLWEILP